MRTLIVIICFLFSLTCKADLPPYIVASQTEVDAGSNTFKAVTPATLANSSIYNRFLTNGYTGATLNGLTVYPQIGAYGGFYVDPSGNAFVASNLKALVFIGNGSGLTNLNGAAIQPGTIHTNSADANFLTTSSQISPEQVTSNFCVLTNLTIGCVGLWSGTNWVPVVAMLTNNATGSNNISGVSMVGGYIFQSGNSIGQQRNGYWGIGGGGTNVFIYIGVKNGAFECRGNGDLATSSGQTAVAWSDNQPVQMATTTGFGILVNGIIAQTGSTNTSGPAFSSIYQTNYTCVFWVSNNPSLTGIPHKFDRWWDVSTNAHDILIW